LISSINHIPEQKQTILKLLVEQLSCIPGIAAIVLGGSYASGTQHANSDLDIGLYYFDARPFSTLAIRQVADSVSVDGAATVTGFYEWGA